MFCSRAEAREISYSFEVKTSHIEVTCSVQGNDSGKTRFNLPAIFDLDPSQPKKIKVYVNAVAQPQEFTSNVIDLVHTPLANIKITYELHKIKTYDSDLYFNISPEYFFFFTQYCLVMPQLPKQEVNEIKFEFPHYHSKIFSNIEYVDIKTKYLNATISELKNIFLLEGRLRVTKLILQRQRFYLLVSHQ